MRLYPGAQFIGVGAGAVEAEGIPIATSAQVADLYADASGRILGVRVRRPDGAVVVTLPVVNRAAFHRFLADYGMIFVLLLLCAFFSVVTYSEQSPSGAAAAEQGRLRAGAAEHVRDRLRLWPQARARR